MTLKGRQGEEADAAMYGMEQIPLDDEAMFPAIKWMSEQIPGGFFVYLADESQRLIHVNRMCLRLFGCETEQQFRELTGFTFRGLVHPEDFEKIQASIDEQIADPANRNLDYVEYRILGG